MNKHTQRKIFMGLGAGLVVWNFHLPAVAEENEPFRHHYGELRQYNDSWLSVCPDKLRPKSKIDYFTDCWTSTFTGRPGFFFKNRLAISRNRTTDKLGITFVQDKNLDKRKPLFIEFENADGEKTMMRYEFGADIKNRANTINEYRFIKTADINEIVEKMKTSDTLVFFLPRQNGDEVVQYSMTGFNEGLAFTEQFATPNN